MKIYLFIRRLIPAIVLVGAMATQVSMAETLDGFDATRAGDYQSALKFWQTRASKGDAQAQFNLALMYHGGLGVKANEAEAVKWYQTAAENNSILAQEYMAVAYQEGWFGLKRDPEKAKYWYKRLSQNGF